MHRLENDKSELRLGLVLNEEFHRTNRWVVATTSYLVNAFLKRFDCCWIQSQQDYENNLGNIDVLLSMEPGWAAPRLEFNRTVSLREELSTKLSYIMYSDPHDVQWREDYFLKSGLDFVLAYYYHPTLYNFSQIPVQQIVHFPWAIPDMWISTSPICNRDQKKLLVFGASQHEAYSVRNWCRTFPFVESSTFSGVENKTLVDEEYIHWLSSHDAVVAAGSDDPRYRLTTPKYFESAAAGALLFAQETEDLERLGFRHLKTCIVFNRSSFEKSALTYLEKPSTYLKIREAGRELIQTRHSISHRLDFLDQHIRQNLENKSRIKTKVTSIPPRKLTSLTYWDQERKKTFTPWIVTETQFTQYFKKYLPVNQNFTCAEVGAYPGVYLCELAKRFQYKPTAIEYSKHCNHIEQLFFYNGIQHYEIINKDFFEVNDRQFDVVSSFGFVEHFQNYDEAIKKHIDLLKPDGYLVLSVPRLDGYQGLLRKLVYTDDAWKRVSQSHHIPIMNLEELRRVVQQCGAQILFADHVLGDKVWFTWTDSVIRPEMRWLVKYLNDVQKFTEGHIPADEFYSPSILLIGQKLKVPAEQTSALTSLLLDEARFAIKKGDFDTAEHSLRKCIDIDQNMIEAYTTLADLLTNRNNHIDALEVLKSAPQHMPQALPILKRLGSNRNNLVLAEKSLLKGITWNPQDREILTCLHSLYSEQNREQDALLIQKSLRSIPDGDTIQTAPCISPKSTSIVSSLPQEKLLPKVIQQTEDYVDVSVGDIEFRLNPSRYLDRELINGRLWEPETVACTRALIRPGMTVIDVGANFGFFTLLFSRWVGAKGRVIGFEPTQEYAGRLLSHVEKNHTSNVRVEQLGLSNQSKATKISIGECSATMHWVAETKPRTTEKITLTRLDDWWTSYVKDGNPDSLDFVKLDLDGHEPQFLEGATRTLLRHQPVLMIEFSKPNYEQGGNLCTDLAEKLETEFGYVLCNVTNGEPYESKEKLLSVINDDKVSVNILCLPQNTPSRLQPRSLHFSKQTNDRTPLRKIFLHKDDIYQPDQWYKRFEHLVRDIYKLDYQLIDLLNENIIKILQQVQDGDALIGRFGHHPKDLEKIRPIYPKINEAFQGRIFPSIDDYSTYDDKAKQIELFQKRNYPIPFSRFVKSRSELDSFITTFKLCFPIVKKQPGGAGSSTVTLAHHADEVTFPCIVQEFCPGNDRDHRINVIGHRVMGFDRLNRENDFRASGSGRIIYPTELENELVALAYRISEENGFKSMSYDFVKKGKNWVLLEISYAYQDFTVSKCPYYYDMITGRKVDKQGEYPQDYILADFLKKHYEFEIKDSSSFEPTHTPTNKLTTAVSSHLRPHILLIADVPNWIFERHCQALRKHLFDEFDFTIKFQGETFNENEYDLIYPLEWNLVPRGTIRTPQKYVTGIRSHISWKSEVFEDFIKFLQTYFQQVHVVSKNLLSIFQPYLPSITYCSHGIDTDFFRRTKHMETAGCKIRIGWAGNRRSPAKGFEQFIKPLGSLPDVELVMCGYCDEYRTQEEMRQFYDSINVYVCSSETEGNNNALMEAAAMERALITTDNGTVSEYLQDGVSAIIVPRQLEAFVKAVENLRDNSSLRSMLGKNARDAVVGKWDWRQRAADYRVLFRNALNANYSSSTKILKPSLTSTATSNADKIPERNSSPDVVSIDALRTTAAAYLQQGQWIECANLCAKILEHRPDDVEILLALGKCFFSVGDFQTAKLVYTRTLELEPSNITANGNLQAAYTMLNEKVPAQPVNSQENCLEQISCPFCNSDHAHRVRQIADIVQCNGCDTVYLRTRPKTEVLEKIYQTYADDGSHMALPKNLEQANASCLKRDYFFQEILKINATRGKILDVGCGWGAFLLNAKEQGFEPTGMELTRKAVRYANEELRIPVVNTQFLDTVYKNESMQVVTMLHVLEHLPQPREAIKKTFDILKPNGLFCGIVPNFNSYCSQKQGEQWFWLDPNYHYVHYTPATLKKHLEEAGFQVDSIYTALGDYGTRMHKEVAVQYLPEIENDSVYEKFLREIDASGQGEEIRFFARKPCTIKNISIHTTTDSDKNKVSKLNDDWLIAELQAAATAIEELQWEEARALYKCALHLACHKPALITELHAAIARIDNISDKKLKTFDSHNPVIATQDPEPKKLAGYSFCIITDGKRPDKLKREIDSIRALKIPHYEILVGGEPIDELQDIVTVPVIEAARAGRLGEMRNRLVERARYDHVIVADDDLVFQPDFYQGLLKFGENYDILCVRFLNPDGTRYWDWATHGGSRGHALLSYEETDPNVYVTGGLCIMKTKVADQVQWNEQLGFYESEDTDFSIRLHEHGFAIKLNVHSTVIHNDARNTQVDNYLVRANELRQLTCAAFRLNDNSRGESLWARYQLLRPTKFTISEPPELECLIEKRDGKYVYLSSETLDGLDENKPSPNRKAVLLRRLSRWLEQIDPFYFQIGGAGDALLLQSTYYDKEPRSTIVSYPNSLAAAKSFFDAFIELEKVYFFPAHSNVHVHAMLRELIPTLSNCKGMGVAPRKDFAVEWNEETNIFKDYKVDKCPAWAKRFKRDNSEQIVTIAPRGSVIGMAGTKRNVIEPNIWSAVIRYLLYYGYQPVILGTPNEREDYPCLEGCNDRRSYCFEEQMELIASSAIFIGADSWGKTFAALAEIPTIVFEATKSVDWRGQKDPSDYIFLDPWDHIKIVTGLETFQETFSRYHHELVISRGDACAMLAPRITSVASESTNKKPQKLQVTWEGSFLDFGSLSHVNRELTRHLIRDPNLRVTRVGCNSFSSVQPTDRSLREIAKQLSSDSPSNTQVTVRHSWPPNWRRPSTGAWVLIQPWEFGSLPSEWVRNLAKVDEVWVPSDYVRRVYVDSGVSYNKVKIVPNGIDPAIFRKDMPPMELSTKKSFKFLFVGGTIRRKGPDLLLSAYLEMFTASDDVCLVIKDFGGQDVYARQTFEAEIQAAQARPNAPEIIYLNNEIPSQDMAGLYTACDCLVHPYRGEGFGLPVLEAMACGLPVIVTAGGSTDDFATDTYAYRISSTQASFGYRVGGMALTRPGWLLEPSQQALNERMQWVVYHREEARAKGHVASDYVRQNWTWERAAMIAAQRLQNLVARKQTIPMTSARLTRKSSTIKLPDCARLGHLGKGRSLFNQKQFLPAWNTTLKAIEQRPFHPEAFLLLAEIAQAAGDNNLAKQSVNRARKFAPNWRPVREFLRKHSKSVNRSRKVTLEWSLPPETNPRLSVCLIVKNEEQYLAKCLESIRSIAEQIVIVDTGSTDRTVEIAREHGAEIYSYLWNDDFSAARNAALEHVTGDWVLILDADEELPATSHQTLLEEIHADSVIAYRLPIIDIGREDEGQSYVPRLFRNAPGLFFVGRIHEQIFSSIEVRRDEWKLENQFSKTLLHHYGYQSEVVKVRDKNARNLRLLDLAIDEFPDEPNLLMNLGLELVRAGQTQAGLEQYIEAFRSLSNKPANEIVPELRETLLTQLCTQLMTVRHFDEIIKILRTPLARNGGLTASLHFIYGLTLIELGKYKDAIDQFHECINKRHQPVLSPIHKDIHKEGPHHCLALCFSKLGQFEKAEEAFNSALAVNAQSRIVRYDYAAFLSGQGNQIEALKFLHALVAERPEEEKFWIAGGKVALSHPRFLEFADDWTGEAVKHFPDNHLLLLQRAETLLLRGQVEPALLLWQKVHSPTNATHLAAMYITKLLNNSAPESFFVTNEQIISQEFIRWYRRLIDYGAENCILEINKRHDNLRHTLPTAARILKEALSNVASETKGGWQPERVNGEMDEPPCTGSSVGKEAAPHPTRG